MPDLRIQRRIHTCIMYIPLLLLTTICLSIVDSIVVPLDSANIDTTLQSSEIVFVNFYADWCRFSQQLKPIFAEASEKFKDKPTQAVVWASVDSDRNPEIAQKYHVSKYPTLKLFRNGEMIKKEYRGQRSIDALSEFVQKQLDGSINGFVSVSDLEQRIDKNRRNVVGYFRIAHDAAFENFRKIGSLLREDCAFWIGSGDEFKQETVNGDRLVFRASGSSEEYTFTGDMTNFEYLKQWLTDKCIPLVREITFENAEELTEEGLPFLILFRDPNDSEADKMFTEHVVRELSDQKNAINCLVADGKRFAHPLHHLGKSERDLPLLAIDSFRHMYLFPDMSQVSVPGKLRQFILDLHSGKLHREFHHGPDPTLATQPGMNQQDNGVNTQPPESIFKQLKPSDSRYTLIHKDEL